MSATMFDFERIHAEFRPKVERYLTHLIGAQDAEDVTQEVFVKISRALTTFRGESRLSTWIYRIATNAAVDRLRQSSFWQTAPDPVPEDLNFDEMRAGSPASSGSGETDALEQEVCREEMIECYRDHIRSLPVNYRTVVALSELEERTASEIGDILGLSTDVVKIRLHRGRARLLKQLKRHCKPEEWL